MDRRDLPELHYITPIGNVPSILDRGILSHALAARVEHTSVADPRVQEKRSRIVVPGGRSLHQYANLYICARNPMLFLRVDQIDSLAVLRVDAAVLELPGVVVSDQNAASQYARFAAAPAGLRLVDAGLVFAQRWTNPHDQIAEWRHKSIKCAEVLVPDRVSPRYIVGAHVGGLEAAEALSRLSSEIAISVNPPLFFRK